MSINRALLFAAIGAVARITAAWGAQLPFTVEDLVRLQHLSDPQISPDGRYVAYVLREPDTDSNKSRSTLWLVDLSRQDALPVKLTTDTANDTSPRWAPD